MSTKKPSFHRGLLTEYSRIDKSYQMNVGELIDLLPVCSVIFSPSAQSSSLMRNLKMTLPFFEEESAHS